MNRKIFWILVSVTLIITSCNREIKQFTGNYSYKLSGEVSIVDDDGEVSYRLVHKNGQMNILEDKSQPNRLIITMNEMNGGCYTIPATVKGDSIVFLPYEFSTNILISDSPDLFSDDDTPSIVYAICASGGGQLNDDILMIDEQWSGHQSGNDAVLLNGPKMKIIAERN